MSWAKKTLLAITGTGIALAAPAGIDKIKISQLPEHLKINVSADEIIYSELSGESTVSYIKITKEEAKKLPNEVSRKSNSVTQRIGDNKYVVTAYAGQRFYRANEQEKWENLKVSTTTKEAFELQTKRTVSAADTGFNTTGTIEETGNWSSLSASAISSDDNIYASCGNSSSSFINCATSSEDGELSDFSFGIPTSATIDGIEVTANWSCSGICSSSIRDAGLGVALSWNDGTSYTTQKDAPDTTSSSDIDSTLGGSADTWGRSWTDTEFANGTFRMAIRNRTDGNDGGGGEDTRLDYIGIKVYYTESGGGGGTTPTTEPTIMFD